MNRRRFIEVAAFGTGLAAGCGEAPPPSNPDGATVTSSTDGSTPTAARTVSDSPTSTDHRDGGTSTDGEDTTTIYVGSDRASGDGTRGSPLNSIQAGLDRARPGDTVRVMPGHYFESPETVRSGEPGAPITVTGPPDAIVAGEKGGEYADGFSILHSHLHLTGLTFDGLQRPSMPADPASYAMRGIVTLPIDQRYLTDIVIKPHGIGNVRASMINLHYVENVEVGEFRVIGPSGLRYRLTDRVGHWGEIVYVGSSPLQQLNAVEETGELEGYDRTNNVHIHHIDNSAGHHHSELVNTKLGTHDILVEYCTDGGGSQNTETWPAASVRLQSYDATLRWCALRDGSGKGVGVGSRIAARRQRERPQSELTKAERLGGTRNALYGNAVTGFDEGYKNGFYQGAFRFPQRDAGQGPLAQRLFCGNEFDGPTDGEPGTPCSESVPRGTGIGHLGGQSPWA